MTEAQIQLQNALTTTFLANLAFLSEYDNELFQRVDELSKMIGDGSYKERYALDFIMENGEFDIYDTVNDKYLYNKNPKKINDDLVKKVELNEKNAIFDLPEYFLFKDESKIDKNKRFDYEKSSDCILATKASTWEYSNCLNDFLETSKKRLKKIRKFIFLGTLLGRHIPKIAQKVDANMYLVLERNLEIFRLSLFAVDYTILANKGAIFSIMDNNLEEEKKISKFITTEGLDNYLIKISSTGINIDEYIDKLLSMIHTERPISYDYIRMLYIYANRTTKIFKNNSYKVLILNKIKEKCNFFDNIPILYLAAGPSLDENMGWIKMNQDKFFIVTIGAAYKKLIANDIKIDMITTLDESDILEELQFDDESVSKISENTIILASVITNERILKKFNPTNLFLFEIFSPLHLKNIIFDGFSIGEIVLAILMSLNPKEIYLIGLDLALNQTTGATHSKASNSVVQFLNLEEKQTRDIFNVDESLIKVKGNLEKEVFTTPFFYSSIKSTEAKIAKKNEKTTIYNLSTHGAYFNGAIPQRVEDIIVNTSISKKDGFLKYLEKNSLTKLEEDSKKEFIKEISFLNSKIKDILAEIKEKDFETYEEFYQKIITLPIELYNYKLSIFYQIIVNYFQLMIPYLSYHFNDVKVKHEKKKLKKIKEIFTKQMEDILNDYILCLERVI